MISVDECIRFIKIGIADLKWLQNNGHTRTLKMSIFTSENVETYETIVKYLTQLKEITDEQQKDTITNEA